MTILTVARPSSRTQVTTSSTVVQKKQRRKANDSLWRLTVEQYHQMIKAGILTDDDPVELLEGLLVQKMSKNPPHRMSTFLVRRMLERLLGDEWYIDSQESVTTADSEPEPDVTVSRGSVFAYAERHPGPADTVLLVEVSDATLHRDRGRKKRLYARAGIPVYWIVNLIKLQVEVYTEPDSQGAPPDYRQRRIYRSTDRIPIVLDGVEVGQILVRDILPPPTASQNEG
ncbi:MAG: Uma2 family endonuclease [Caldilinea sp. CFX5]|nr:Uma2 family endonuclease [Caldilinea sp. CFX5]